VDPDNGIPIEEEGPENPVDEVKAVDGIGPS
jgi:hypothetical protein